MESVYEFFRDKICINGVDVNLDRILKIYYNLGVC